MTTPQLADLLGVPERKVLSWIERGYLHNPGRGTGNKRTWTPRDRELARIVSVLEPILRVEMLKEITWYWHDHPAGQLEAT